jgi:hypothetical protein
MDNISLTAIVYLGLTAACATSVWLFLAARRDLRRLRKAQGGSAVAPEVARLRSAGLDARRIAQRLGLPAAEIRLLIELEQQRSQRTTTLAAA